MRLVLRGGSTSRGWDHPRSWDAVRTILFLLCTVPMIGSDAPLTNRQASVFSNFVRGGAFSTPVAQLRCAARMIETLEWDELDPEFPHSPWWLTADFVGLRVALDSEATPVKPRPISLKAAGQ